MDTIPEIRLKPIGYVESPYKTPEDTPPDSSLSDASAKIVVFPEYKECIFGLFPEDTILIVSYLHLSQYRGPIVKRRRDNLPAGVFATRSPYRPNPIGVSLTRIREIKENIIIIRGIDLVDKTPVLDIKIWNRGR